MELWKEGCLRVTCTAYKFPVWLFNNTSLISTPSRNVTTFSAHSPCVDRQVWWLVHEAFLSRHTDCRQSNWMFCLASALVHKIYVDCKGDPTTAKLQGASWENSDP
jgi:hypothetical protein